ncbi:MAG: DUF3089 domain-containing protein [Pseudomonadota bacterium]
MALVLAAGLAVMAGLSWVFQDAVGLALINPNRSYEAYTPPPAPEYADADTWLARGEGEGAADVFFIHNNVYRGDGQWNARYDRETQLPFLRDVLLPLEAGPFAANGRLWAPRYRQPTFYARFTQKQPGAASRDTAYRDVAMAFQAFLAEREPGKPFFLVGYGDGALLAGRLLEQKVVGDETLLEQLAGAYAVGMPLPAEMFAEFTCQGPEQPHCLVAFAPVDERFEPYRERLSEKTLTLRPRAGYASTSSVELLCRPPALGPKSKVALADGWQQVDLPIEGMCTDGLFVFKTPDDKRARQTRFFGRQWYPDDVNLFFGPLAEDSSARLEALLREMAVKANTAPPMMEAEEIEEAPIRVVPNGG